MAATPLRWVLVPALAAIALAAGCGGDGGDETSDPTEWANGVCTAITTWTDSLTSSADSLKGGNLSKESLQSAADDVKNSTDAFVDDLKGLGKPDTESGQQAKDLIERLADDLDEHGDKVESTVDSASGASGVLNAVSVVSSTLQSMGQRVSSTFNELEQLDPAGELGQAFQEADSCARLRNSGS